MSQRHVVLGIGNILNRDEGLGVRALDLLEQQVGPVADVEYVDGGVMGLSLLPLVEDCEHLLVLDAIDAGAEPGTFVEMNGQEIRLFTGIKMSEHQITFQEVLGLAFIRDKLPPYLHLVGAQPADLTIGLEISDKITETLPQIVTRAAAVIRDWGFEVPAPAPIPQRAG
jgi:hydrogenase maturation protease